jgi:hypothetical protein
MGLERRNGIVLGGVSQQATPGYCFGRTARDEPYRHRLGPMI